MKKTTLALLVILGLISVGCSGGGDASGGTAADNAAASSSNSQDAVKVDPAQPNNPETGSGDSGIRSVPPTQAGDRN